MAEPGLLGDRIAQRQPAFAAQVLERQDPAAGAAWLAQVSAAGAAAVLACLLPAEAAGRIAAMAPSDAAAAVVQMPPVRAAVFLRLLAPEMLEAILAHLPEAGAGPLRYLLRYPEGVVGGWMEAGAFLLPRDTDVAEALQRTRDSARELDRVLFVVDREQTLCGYVPLSALLREPPERPLAALLKPVPYLLRTRTSLGAARNHPGWQEFAALPVVNREDRVVGLLHLADLQQALSAGLQAQAAFVLHSALSELLELSWHGLADLLDGGLGAALATTNQAADSAHAR